MTNEQTYERFSVIWNGKPDAYLCVQRDEDVIRREQQMRPEQWGHPSKYKPRGMRTRVLEAVPADRFVTGRAVALSLRLTAEDVQRALSQLAEKQKLVRQRTDGRYEYKRVAA